MRGIYIDDQNMVVYAGNRKVANPNGLTWVEVEFGDLEKLVVEGSYIYRWDGENITSRHTELEFWLNSIVRPERDRRLAASDKYMLPDYPITSQQRANVETYRQGLRDFPGSLTQITDPIPWLAEPL